MHFSQFSLVLVPVILFSACSSSDQGTATAEQPEAPTYIMDPHSAARPDEAVITHLDLDIAVDMDAHRITGTASYDLAPGHGPEVRFDTEELEISGVTDGAGNALKFSLGDTTFLGQALVVELPSGTDRVSIAYSTSPGARALQWLSAAQTSEKKHPFLFTQGQAILTRTWIPVQDSPGIRFTYTAKVKVPSQLMAVMSASNPQERNAEGVYSFRMDQPIPAYLIALAVGDLGFASLGARSGVYAEPGLLEKAAWEFADTEDMLTAAEALYGPYRWDRYDIIVLPASFPFGGMENPRLTFATPTIIAGDRSLTALVAHEMAHSWSGNLVTNATWNDFWLNEGFTVYFEKRICEAVYGPDYASMLSLLGYQDLVETVEKINAGKHPEDTRLKLDLTGRDPDDGVTEIAYEKGYSFLRLLEEKVGREKFDAFLRDYFDRFAFQGMTTEKFLAHLDAELLKPNNVQVDVNEWVFGRDLPADLVVPTSDAFTRVDGEMKRWLEGAPAADLDTKDWVTFQWMHFLRALPADLSNERMKELDTAFGFTATGNSEVVAVWLQQSILHNYAPANDRLVSFLTTVGRRKFLVPLYDALITTEPGMAKAKEIYRTARPNYHAVATRTIDPKLGWGQPVEAASH